MEETDNQIDNTLNKPWLWKKGQSGNVKGRPKGKTMKEYMKEYLSCLNDEERDEFLIGLPKEVIWKMAEGNPQSNTEILLNQNTLNPLDPKHAVIANNYEDEIARTTKGE